MSSCAWGKELWDNREFIEKHTHNGIDFLEKCSSFVKDRIRIEQEYAKSLRKLVKQYQFRKKEEDDLLFTYQHSFKSFLKETDDFAGQREVIAENIQENVLKQMQKSAVDSKQERRKAIQTLNEHKQHLEQLHKALQVAKRKYDQASEDAHNALKAYETANQSLDLTKAQILKFQKASQDKGHAADKAADEYRLATDNFNKTQTLYYDHDLPNTIQNELQKPEEQRVDNIRAYFTQISEIQKKVQPIVLKCLEEMVNSANICNSEKDSQTLVDIHKTGESPPVDLQFEEWGKQVEAITPSPNQKVRQKTVKTSVFGMSSKKKDVITNETVANDYSDLPPAQRRKKFNKTIAALKEQVGQLERARAGMLKIIDTSKQFGGDVDSIQSQIETNTKETERIMSLLHQYNCYLEAMDSADGKPPAQPTVSVNIPPPPVARSPASPSPMSPQGYPQGEFDDDELRCTVLYDFTGSNEGELTVYAGEELAVVEEDDGGWTRVVRGDEEGYIPTSYVQDI